MTLLSMHIHLYKSTEILLLYKYKPLLSTMTDFSSIRLTGATASHSNVFSYCIHSSPIESFLRPSHSSQFYANSFLVALLLDKMCTSVFHFQKYSRFSLSQFLVFIKFTAGMSQVLPTALTPSIPVTSSFVLGSLGLNMLIDIRIHRIYLT